MTSLGFSVYKDSFHLQEDLLSKHAKSNAFIFISLHVPEEFNEQYCKKMIHICQNLADMKYRVIADVSPITLEQFSEPDLLHLAQRLSVYAFRLDFGFSDNEIVDTAKKMPIVLNASTVSDALCQMTVALGNPVMAMHNFYPRRETGLDADYFIERTNALKKLGVQVLAFIPGSGTLRGPLFEKLPTLEHHRDTPPFVSYLDLIQTFNVDGVFVGDPGISDEEQARIIRYESDDVIEVPAHVKDGYESLYGKVFTCRIDSPKSIIRAEESRIHPLFERPVVSDGGVLRPCGTITMDNADYGRYAGEIQLLRKNFGADHRVNVIGTVQQNYLPLLDLIQRGKKFCLVNN